jgi:hypothetical protein
VPKRRARLRPDLRGQAGEGQRSIDLPSANPVAEGVENRRDYEWYDEEQHEGEYDNVDQTVLHS